MSEPLACLSGLTQCPLWGAAPNTYISKVDTKVFFEKKPAANISHAASMANIPSFCTCTSLANPTTASLTAAAMGALVPGPCAPVTSGMLTPGAPTVLIQNLPAVKTTSITMCAWAGLIKLNTPGQMTVTAG